MGALAMTADNPLLAQLSSLDILRGVDSHALLLLERCPIRTVAPGEILLTAGQPNHTMYLVLDGKFHVELPGAKPGSCELATSVAPGQALGEISLIDRSPATRTVCADEQSRVLAVDEVTFWLLVRVSHVFAMNLLLALAGRLRATGDVAAASAQLVEALRHETLVDGLTGVHNRRWLDTHLARLVNRHKWSGAPLSVILIDVDHFKRINDTFGHPAGDTVLRKVAEALSIGIRPTDIVARYGGEEFVIVLPGTPLAGAVVAADRLRRSIPSLECHGPDEQLLPPTHVSAGIAQLRGEEGVAELLARADAALYRAKGNGRDRVEI